MIIIWPDVLFWVKDNDVEFGRVKADQSDVGGERDRHAESGDLDLWQYVLHLSADFDL